MAVGASSFTDSPGMPALSDARLGGILYCERIDGGSMHRLDHCGGASTPSRFTAPQSGVLLVRRRAEMLVLTSEYTAGPASRIGRGRGLVPGWLDHE